MTDAPFPLDGATEVRAGSNSAPTPSPSRFAPGSLVAERYRIIAQLGRGGMGEVYRADDLKLGHAVALKFLPREFANDRVRMERLIAEVRIGRQVSHPNVCRLYDIVEWEGTHFIAMEYVDGEDLASLLRRIGRLPADKALDIARDLAAGLAAAHDLGVIHRDLKPANVMIDGRGRARITDFGLATLDGDPAGRGFAGTPSYMAPEQLRGEPASVRSDLYALGLILFEMFTGRPAFEGGTLDEIVRKRSSAKTPSVASLVRDVDPAVERVIARCLDDNPAARPPSAHAVIASLPGGDPLAAAVAAGETPSPEMVAAAGAAGDIRPAMAWTLFTAVVVGLIALALMASRMFVYSMVPLPKSTEVLQAHAEEIAERVGYTTPPADVAGEWIVDNDFIAYMTRRDKSIERWRTIARLQPGVVGYVARLSPQPMEAWMGEWRITSYDPPLTEPGMMSIQVDSRGRLARFFAVPPDRVDHPASTPIDWGVFFREAALDPARFHQVPSTWSVPVNSDVKLAWDGTSAEQPDLPIHIEGAARAGRPVAFALYGPWDVPRRIVPAPRPISQVVAEAANMALEVAAYGIGIILALGNLRRGRGDRKSAFRLAAFCFLTAFAAYLFRADHRGFNLHEWEVVILGSAARALLGAATTWLLYVALEPYVRRKWPHMLIGWSRLLAGRVRDPMVGRDALFGALGGVALVALLHLSRIVPPWLGLPAPPPMQVATSPFAGIRHAIYFALTSLSQYILATITLLGVLVFMRVLLRSRFLALLVTGTILSGAFLGATSDLRVSVPVAAASGALLLYMMTRRGLLATAVTAYVWSVLRNLPITLDMSAWYFDRALIGFMVVVGLALFGLIVSLGGKPLFGTPLFDD